MGKLSLGLDYGTESARALLVDVETGAERGTAVRDYPNGVITERLPETDVRLGPEWVLQDPDDYWAVLPGIVADALSAAGAASEDVIGIGIDFTSCTMLPTTADGAPLCRDPRFRLEPHAWAKLWKHHAAQPEAERINAVATARREPFLERYGGRTSSEWLFAKAWQILDEAPEIYAHAARLIEAGDWLVWQLAGAERRSACQAGYKGMWSYEEGYPSPEFFRALDPGLERIVAEKLSTDIYPVGARAGDLTARAAAHLGLPAGTPVGVAIIDAHAAVPAATITDPGKMLMILGTSGCHLMLGRERRLFAGIAGVVRDGILPGYYGYEAGQPATGDMLQWFLRHAAPDEVHQAAREAGISAHALLTQRAAAVRPGESGLLALDWWNGNRSVLMDADLSGLIVGMTLETRPEEVYRALIEAGAFGTRVILDNFAANGLEIAELYACGGLAEKHELLLQIYADVTRRPIRTARSGLASALGAAMLGAVAAGEEAGGCADLAAAARQMGGVQAQAFHPDAGASRVYEALYRDFTALHDLFGRGGQDVMRHLRSLRRQ